MDSNIGKLRSIFHAEGRDGEWDKRLGLGNPAADTSVKDYLRLVSAEQLQARITPKQATPFFVDKLTMLSLHLQREMEKSTSAIQRFIIARDQAYFETAFFSSDRPGDLGQVKVPEILRFPNCVERSGYSYGTRTATCICYSCGSQKISMDFSVIADSCLSKLLYLPLEGLSDSSECRFFDPD